MFASCIPVTTVQVFDPLEYDYSAPVVKLLTDSFQERFVITKGARAPVTAPRDSRPVTAAPSAAPAAARKQRTGNTAARATTQTTPP
eukprot:scaffold101935_cov62-Phaeocystis_antarctica.AAC.2